VTPVTKVNEERIIYELDQMRIIQLRHSTCFSHLSCKIIPFKLEEKVLPPVREEFSVKRLMYLDNIVSTYSDSTGNIITTNIINTAIHNLRDGDKRTKVYDTKNIVNKYKR